MSQLENAKKAQLFSNRLIGARNRAMLSQAELAGAVDASLRSVQNWENGSFVPHGKTLRKLCEVLGVGAEYLFGERESYHFEDRSSTALNEDRPPAAAETSGAVRAESHAYLDRVLDACETLRKMIWTVEELKRHFPISSTLPSDAQRIAKRAAAEPDKNRES